MRRAKAKIIQCSCEVCERFLMDVRISGIVNVTDRCDIGIMKQCKKRNG